MDTPYTIVDLEQGTQSWLEWRQNGIGASDAPIIMGENPWKSSAELLDEKKGPAVESRKNAAMLRGIRLEPEARSEYISVSGIRVAPACLQSMEFQWLRASLDGISENGESIVEIKCGESVYRKTARTRSVPTYYYGQLQHILAITGLATMDFWCYLPDRQGILLPVDRNAEYIEKLIDKERSFWEAL
ncbi:MAG: hypothetical protein GY866_39715 [Proteobacteria bacterium]|nr:hypothetical protein [Pseudomonadota bacterium]